MVPNTPNQNSFSALPIREKMKVPREIKDLVEEDHHTKTSLRRHTQRTYLRTWIQVSGSFREVLIRSFRSLLIKSFIL
ncbi:hypothetical protein Lalb_Chr19g0128241 [Lupinus albus]|uniref:Uncharacterized protein n=1 Tax=Lupinus albus TaxID=3870 RepID=A0A6A4NNP3_LUPAL|nr:hypothetical protein Lalb_Chr19g0128241 [Lupinus albus]